MTVRPLRLGLRRRAATVRKKLYRRATVLRTALMLRFFLPLRARRTARLRYAAVLDGQTVNLHAELPGSVTRVGDAEIELRRGRESHRTPARVYEGAGGRLLMDAAVLLGDEVGGVPVTPGRWKLRLHVRSGGSTRRVPLLLLEPPTPYDGPTRPMEVSPITGHRYRVGRTATGTVRVVCGAARAAVEVVNVHIEHAGIRVDFRVLGMRPDAPWAEFVASGRRVPRPLAVVEPGVWRVAVPLADMKPLGRRAEHWDVLMCSAEHRPVRVARRLHDVRNPGRVFAMRKIVVAPAPGHLMTIEPRYTPAGNLRFTCSSMAAAE
ncbi:hypothetical protein [Actinacidiphila glaucinigra]|uniref:hypothetical protein n=1 Tax=Actinacidiphila glaucinigra TaxID=235986 RepID=UPI0029B6DD06|nr:hypothetical protein [Streptomyces sp. PA03-3a]